MPQAFETQQPQMDEGPTFRTLQSLLEAAEPAGAAANVLAFLLLKASPADQLPQVWNSDSLNARVLHAFPGCCMSALTRVQLNECIAACVSLRTDGTSALNASRSTAAGTCHADRHARPGDLGLQRLDALAGGSLAANVLQPLRTHSMRCLVPLERAAAAATQPAASAAAVDANPPTGGAASAAGAGAAVQPEPGLLATRGRGAPSLGAPSLGASNEDTDAMLVVQRLIYALDRVLEVCGSDSSY